jgi:glycine betaine catabolism B
MMRFIDELLDHITMYRLVLYHLGALIAASFVLGFFKIVPHDPTIIAFSTALILAVCLITNRTFARVFGVPANIESTYITGLILTLILDPVSAADTKGVGALIFASVWAIASKFIFALRRKPLFNPAAIGAVLAAFLLDHPATWWVGANPPLLPLVLAGGILIVHKIQRLDLVVTFIFVDFATILATTAPSQYRIALTQTALSTPLFFFAFVMLTEPLTAPTTRWPRLVFGALVGFLAAPNVHIGSFYFTPELALLIGNLFAFLASPNGRFMLKLERIEQASADTYDFIFNPERKFAFQPGQYLEWTLGLDHPDNRGNRRYFTIASAPTDGTVRVGVKFYRAPSAFKRSLGAMTRGDTIYASQLAGDFTLPEDPNVKIAFLAGGIGITPFRSMLQYLLDRNEARPIVLLYGNECAEDITYRDVLDAAVGELGIQTIYVVARNAGPGEYPGVITGRLVRQVISDYRERTFYISGPQGMVKALRHTLRRMGIHNARIKVDFFPGYG